MRADGSAPLKKRQWEHFCAVATGYAGGDPVTATDAYLAAYPRTRSRDAARANAARLAARPEIAARCAWMREQLCEAGKLDAASIRAKIIDLRLDVIERTRATKNKRLALEAARDLDRMLGFARDVPGGGAAPFSGDRSGGGVALESITLNLQKLLGGGA